MFSGSRYFVFVPADRAEISHFHESDGDEIWFYGEGCGMRIAVPTKGTKADVSSEAASEAGPDL